MMGALWVVGFAMMGGLAVSSLGMARDPWVWRLPWAWALGQGLLSLSAGLLLLAGAPLELALMVPAAVAVFSWRLLRARSSGKTRGFLEQPALLGRAAQIVLVLLALSAFLTAWLTPGLGWDGLAIWGLKAKTLAQAGTLPLGPMAHPSALPSHPEYPLHLPLLGGLAGRLDARFGGGFGENTLPLLASFDLLAIGWILMLALGRLGASAAAIPGAAIPGAGIPGMAVAWTGAAILLPLAWSELGEGKADLNVAFFVLAAVVAFGRWLDQDGSDPRPASSSAGTLYWGAVCAGLAGWSKQEGLVWCALLCGLVFLLGRGRRLEALKAGCVAMGLALPWHLVRRIAGLETEPFALSLDALDRILPTAAAMLLEAGDLATWSLLWPLTLVGLLALVWRWRRVPPSRSESLKVLSLVAGVSAIGGFFVASPHDLDWHLQTALARLLLQWWPVAALVAGSGIATWLTRRGGPAPTPG